ncbi:MAG: PQQ-dependent catabolism-associated CXXCW motif protein [Methylobacteriaceae bacterium]|nr:PQQ-dependent catabolism-associated CXXCW motif protein [Methylobacteriaceae bacterium]
MKLPPEPTGYRLEDYRAPTPATLSGARVVTTAEAHALWTSKAAAFVDVLPQAPRPANLPDNVLWRDKPRFDIPGSIWLPDTGYGALAPEVEHYFLDGLARASGDKTRALLFYCQRDCWMSWNAAKRALQAGYINVIWYPEGTEGWSDAQYPFEERRPEPRG